jgi:hypothetical protein
MSEMCKGGRTGGKIWLIRQLATESLRRGGTLGDAAEFIAANRVRRAGCGIRQEL